MPIVLGNFGETDISTCKMIKIRVKLEANKLEKVEVNPLNDENSIGSIYHAMRA